MERGNAYSQHTRPVDVDVEDAVSAGRIRQPHLREVDRPKGRTCVDVADEFASHIVPNCYLSLFS